MAKKNDVSSLGDQTTYHAQRDGMASALRPNGSLVWLHFPRVEDVLDCAELVRLLHQGEMRPTVLVTSNETKPVLQLRRKLPHGVVHQYLPKNMRKSTQAFLETWKPDICIWFSNDLDVEILHQLAEKKTFIIYGNAKPKRLSRIKQFLGIRYRAIMKRFDKIIALSDKNASLCEKAGASSSKVFIMDQIRSGGNVLPHDEGERSAIVKEIGARSIWYGVGIQSKEIDIIIKSHKYVARRMLRLLLIIQPANELSLTVLKAVLEKETLIVGLRSLDRFPKPETQVFIIDQANEEGLWYRVAPVSFLGGSLVDEDEVDPLNSAALGSALVHGSNFMRHARSIDILKQYNATCSISSGDELGSVLKDIIVPDRAAELAQAAWLATSVGALTTDYYFTLIETYLAEKEE